MNTFTKIIRSLKRAFTFDNVDAAAGVCLEQCSEVPMLRIGEKDPFCVREVKFGKHSGKVSMSRDCSHYTIQEHNSPTAEDFEAVSGAMHKVGKLGRDAAKLRPINPEDFQSKKIAKRKRRNFTAVYKADAVALIEEMGSIYQAARQLDIDSSMLRRWKNEAKVEMDLTGVIGTTFQVIPKPPKNPLDGLIVTYLGKDSYRFNLREDWNSTMNADYLHDGNQIEIGLSSGNSYSIHDIHDILRTCDRAALALRLAQAQEEAKK